MAGGCALRSCTAPALAARLDKANLAVMSLLSFRFSVRSFKALQGFLRASTQHGGKR